MDLFDLLFVAGPAVQVIFKLGYVPEESEFYEMTSQQYQEYFDTIGWTDQKVFILLPNDKDKYKELAAGDVICMTEAEKLSLKSGEAIINKLCDDSGKQFNNFTEKLYHAAAFLPDVFSQGTAFEKKK